MGPPQGLCYYAPWAWEEQNIWWFDMMEELEAEEEEEGGGGGGGVGLHFSVRFDARKPVLDHTLLNFPFSALFSFLGWSKKKQRRQESEEGVESMAAVAVAVVAMSLAGFFVSDQRACQRRHPSLQPRSNSVARRHALPGLNDGLRILSNEESLVHVIHGASVRGAPVLGTTNETSTTSASADDTDMTGTNVDGKSEEEKQSEMEQEIERLRNLSELLLERERKLELQMLEYYGLKEQKAAVRELETRLSITSMEARFLGLKVESLREENQRLGAQVSELEKAKAKLDCTKAKIKVLKRQLQSEQEEARQTVASLRERIAVLEKGGVESECQLARARELEQEAAELRKANASLEEENSELALRLQSAQQIASAINMVLEEDILEEARHLRETNDKLSKEIEQLRSDHCAHVEELVYLKWVNACLRYELRNYHPSQGHTAAKDLSKSMSYRSSEKAKQLMIEYDNLGFNFNLDAIPDLQESNNEQSHDEPKNNAASATSMATKRTGPNKLKFLSNIKKLVSGKGPHHKSKKSSTVKSPGHAMQWLSSHDVLDSNSYESTSSCPSAEQTPTSSITTVESHARERRPVSISTAPASRRLEAETARSKSDLGASYGREVSRYHALRPEHPAELDEFHVPEEHELKRYSEAFRSPEVSTRTKGMQSNT